MKLFRIHNPDHLFKLLPIRQPDPPGASGPIRFQAGTLQDLRRMTEHEWEQAKKKALRWQPEDR